MQELKNLIKLVLSRLYFLFNKSPKKIIEIDKYCNLFFGYYDVSSFNLSENLIACHGQVKADSEEVDIIIYNLIENTYEIIDTTLAWNYQQGSRLMWFDDNNVIYNKYDQKTKKYYSVIKNIHNLSETILTLPIQALSKSGFLISLCYYNLNRAGTEYGYKYETLINEKISISYFNKSVSNLDLFDVNDCLNLLKVNKNNISKPHINHILISPNNKYFIFIYRFYINDKRFDNLFGYQIESNKLNLLIDNQVISHYTYRSNEELLMWCIIDDVPGYYSYNFVSKSLLLKLKVNEDGHPTFIDSNLFITDTYPNIFSRQKLSLIELNTGVEKLLLNVSHPEKYSSYNRCDLHPSLSNSKTKYQIDFIHKKRRKICVGNL